MSLFTRSGAERTSNGTIKGKPVYHYVGRCNRCGGAGGSDKWAHTGYTCYDCGGNGRGKSQCEKLYTADELAKLNARKAKADAKRAAAAEAKRAAEQAAADARRAEFMAAHGALIERAQRFADRSEFVADVVSKMLAKAQATEKQLAALASTCDKIEAGDALRAASNYVGSVGQRLECAVTVERVNTYERPAFGAYNAAYQTVFIVSMRDEAGNMIVSKSSSFSAEKGERFTIRATVKEHSEYRGEKQTTVQRVAIKDVISAPPAQVEA